MVVEVASLLVEAELEAVVDEDEEGEAEARRVDDIEGRICIRVCKNISLRPIFDLNVTHFDGVDREDY